MCPEKRLHQTAFDFWLILCEKPYQRSEMYPQKTFTSGSLQLLVNPLRKISPATHCNGPKKCNSRQPSAFGQSPAKRSASLRRYAPKKRSGQRAFGFWPIPRKKSLQPSKMCPEKRSHQAAFGFWSILCRKPLKRPDAMT